MSIGALFSALRSNDRRVVLDRNIDLKRVERIKELWIDYKTNPSKYFDQSSFREYGSNSYVVNVKPFEEIMDEQLLGEGHYSCAYTMGEKYTIKINNNREDAAYPHFVRFCLENKRLACIPKFYYKDNWNGFNIYIMERLESLSEVEGSLLTDVATRYRRGEGDKYNNRLLQIPNDFVNTIAALNTYHKKHELSNKRVSWDLHAGNLMLRGNMPVVIDPWC